MPFAEMRIMRNRNSRERIRRSAPLRRVIFGLLTVVLAVLPPHAGAQINTTTVQGTVYRADGTPASGTLLVNWPAFTTPQNQAVAAGNLSASIGADGFVSLNLMPNTGALPAGSYYTAVYHLSDGTVNQEYWVVPAAASASIASVRAQLEPSTIAMQPVTPAYVQAAIAALGNSWLPLTGGTLTGPLTAPSLSVIAGLTANIANNDMGRTPYISVKQSPYNAQGNSTNGTDGNDDTTALQNAINAAFASGSCSARVYLPHGLYRVTSSIIVNPPTLCSQNTGSFNNATLTIQGDGEVSTGIADDISGGAPLLLLAYNNAVRYSISNLTLYGLGSVTTGNAIENINGWTTLDNVIINGFGGICLLQNGERQYLYNVKFLNCRQPWVQGAVSANESYAHSIEALEIGYTENPFTHSGGYYYDVNATNGVLPGPNQGSGGGPTPLVQNTRAGIVLAWNAVNNEIDGCSIKNGLNISAVRVIHGENMEIRHCYFESGSSFGNGLGENMSIINGGYNTHAIATGPITSTTIPTGLTNPAPINAWSVTLNDGSWFVNHLGETGTLYQTASGNSYVGYIYPPDFVAGGTAPSSIGGGILQGNYEQVGLFGTVGNTLYIQTRGYNGTTVYNWPAGAIYVEGEGRNILPSNALQLVDNHFEGFQLKSGYSIASNVNAGEPIGAEMLNGWMPDLFVSPTTIAGSYGKSLLFEGNNRVRTATLEADIESGVQMPSSDYAGLWSNTAAGFDTCPLTLGQLGGLTIQCSTYSDGITARSLVEPERGYVDSNYSWQGHAAGYRTYIGTTSGSVAGVIDQFIGGTYNICDASGSANVPAFCNYLDNAGVWKRLSYNGSSYTALGGYATTDTSGNLSVTGALEAQGGVSGATINNEITVDGVTYATLNAAWSAALSQVTSSGRDQTVRLGPGSFPVTATLTEPANGACVSLLGSAGTTVNADSAQIATTLTVPNALNGDVFYLGNASQAQGCTFKDLNLLAGGNATHGFELQWFRGTLIDNVSVNDTTAEGILLGEENTASGHQANFLLRNVTVSYSSAAFTPASRSAYGVHLLKTAIDSHLDDVTVRNALTAAVYNEGTGNTGYLIHGFGYPYTCSTGPCVNNASSGSAANASYATSYVIYDTGGSGSVWTDTYIDSPAIAGFYVGANGVEIHGGHIQWPDITSFPAANLAYVASNVTNNLLIADIDCLEMASGVNWITFADSSGTPPTYSSIHHLTGCGNYYQALEDAEVTGFSSGGANINDPSGAIPRVWSTPVASASSYPAFAAQMYTGYQGDAFQAHFSGSNPFFNVTYQGTIRSSGGLALSTIINTASTLTLTAANKNVIANAASGAQTITLPSCYTPLPDKASPTGLEFTIIKSDSTSNAVTLQTVSSQNINYNGVSAQTLAIGSAGKRTLVCGPDYNWYAY